MSNLRDVLRQQRSSKINSTLADIAEAIAKKQDPELFDRESVYLTQPILHYEVMRTIAQQVSTLCQKLDRFFAGSIYAVDRALQVTPFLNEALARTTPFSKLASASDTLIEQLIKRRPMHEKMIAEHAAADRERFNAICRAIKLEGLPVEDSSDKKE